MLPKKHLLHKRAYPTLSILGTLMPNMGVESATV